MPSRSVWTTSHNVKGSAFSLTYVKLEIVCCQLVGKVYILPLYKPPFVTENDHSLHRDNCQSGLSLLPENDVRKYRLILEDKAGNKMRPDEEKGYSARELMNNESCSADRNSC